ncbi:hypothetical protein ULMA_19400 [Patiriisocius marinus]|uniref:Por secretion system C-terminal sorting domain-containing protein n=1 Tax=Patiriisocius marinus TaxID=1397112 RepID=A0A5J4IZ83_9FLAO|nr:zinc-dependent metalloprotease [Patiriisocius marinus]GER59832.1 hypothetical protein ULMA_19400 [Patiriisocius marinus]
MKKSQLITLLVLTSVLFLLITINLNTASHIDNVQSQSVLDIEFSKEEIEGLKKKKAFSIVMPHFKQSFTQAIQETMGTTDSFAGFPATCFAPDTDQSYIDNFYENRNAVANSLGLNNDSRFNIANRWFSTAINGSGLGQGDITTLTWSYVPDGTPIGNGGCSVPGESSDNSNFIAFFNSIYGPPTVTGDYTTAPWHNVFVTMFNSWSEASGLIFVYEPNDDGATVTGFDGVLGTRGDMRISGHDVDGNSNVLACNFFPNNGDMVIDTADAFYINNPTVGTANVLTHEIGHGLGIAHVCPVNETKLMEPFVTVNFLGPQEDDILATNRNYGDPDEGNDTFGSATFLGSNVIPASYSKLQRSIDDDTDVDYFSFTINAPALLSATLSPTGSTYLDGQQNPVDGSCAVGTPFNALNISDLMFEVLNTNGSTVIATANTNSFGEAENLTDVNLPLAGTYFVRVKQQGAQVDNVQMYDLDLSLISAVVLNEDVTISNISSFNELEMGLTNSEQLDFTLSNLGSISQSGIPYEVAINNVVVATETYAPSLPGGTSVTVTVPIMVDLSNFGFYNICITTLLASDENTSNDEFCKTVFHINCIPETTNDCSIDGIKQFVLGSINVDDGLQGCNTDSEIGIEGYSNRTAYITDLDKASGLNTHILQASTLYDIERIKVWIDLNDNGLFTDAGEELLNTTFTITDGTLETFSITIPTNTSNGQKLLRVRAFDALEDPSTTGPCDDIVYGETQDYLVNIINSNSVCIGETKTWVGSWSPAGEPDATNPVVIATNFSGDLEACSLRIESNATLTVPSGNYIRVQGDITVTNGSSLEVEHQGSVVQVLDDAITINDGAINVAVTTPNLIARQFMVVGSPMSTTNQSVFNGAHQVLNHNTDNYVMYTGQAVTGVNFYDDNNNDLANHTGVLNPSEGYIVRPSLTASGAYNYNFNNGTLNSGNVSYNAGFNGTQDNSANLLANPYPSAIDANLLLGDPANATVVTELYFWEHLTAPTTTPGPYGTQNFSMEDISMYNLTGPMPAANDPGTSTMPNGIISTGQGFGIKAKASGSINFTNAMRVTSGNTTLRTSEEMNRLWLKVRQENKNTGSTNLIGFTNAATSGLDVGFDADKMGTSVSLYTHLQDGTEQLSIQAREAFNTSITIPMGFSTYFDEDLTYTISVLNSEGALISNATVYLIDNLLGTITNLNEGDYEFATTGGVFNNRFTVQFENEEILDVTNNLVESVRLFPNPTTDVLQIHSPNALIENIFVYDLQGRVVQENAFEATEQAQLNLNALKSAIYFVKVFTEKGIITKRVIKN